MKDHTLRAVLFDLGETLLDTGGRDPNFAEEDRRDLGMLYVYLQQAGEELPPWERFYSTLSGLLSRRWEASRTTHLAIHIADILREGLSEIGIAPERLDMSECVRCHYQWSDERAAFYSDALPTLRWLHGRGLRLGLISNTIWPAWCHDETLTRLGARDLFHVRLYSADVGYQKPHPFIFAQALARLEVSPAEAVFVGDRLAYDIAGAQRAGMKAILREVPYRREESPEIVPDGRIARLSELPEMLARLYASWSLTSAADHCAEGEGHESR